MTVGLLCRMALGIEWQLGQEEGTARGGLPEGAAV